MVYYCLGHLESKKCNIESCLLLWEKNFKCWATFLWSCAILYNILSIIRNRQGLFNYPIITKSNPPLIHIIHKYNWSSNFFNHTSSRPLPLPSTLLYEPKINPINQLLPGDAKYRRNTIRHSDELNSPGNRGEYCAIRIPNACACCVFTMRNNSQCYTGV